ncbi:structural maintenance of chromosomes protein 5-like [Amphiura filiformis]|uniref:structural maintenance of chromosomes protein 5-like n=1 Tax=Amphiura filiformis TaxID=82378 RepID=UPI003B2191E8
MASNSEDLVEGAIVRIKLEDFVTYDSCEFYPGPHLNVIMGPNGTGKSTIVCAMCLGLAGSTNLLGRAKEVGEFVKHGCNKAVVEIELHNTSGKNYTIRREIHKQGNRSNWELNGHHSTMNEVKKLVGELNIQIGNLCQFLPQDKVVEFANMSNIELLDNTEQAIGQPSLYENHCRLKDYRHEEKQLQHNHKEKKQTLEKLVQQNERLETEVERYNTRQQLLERVEILEKKRAWVEYDNKRVEYITQKNRKEELTKLVRDARRQNSPLQAKLDAAQRDLQQVDVKMKEITNEVRQAANNANRKHDRLAELNSEVQEAVDDLKDKKNQEQKRRNKVQGWKQIIEGLRKELEEMEPADDLQPKIDENHLARLEVSKEVQKIDKESIKIRSERETYKRDMKECEKRLKRLNDQRNQRLNTLRNKYRDTYNAVEWLRNNPNKFKRTIHEPIALVINVLDTQHARYIEHCIPMNDMIAFVCEDADDMELFLREVRDKQRLRVNAVKAPTQGMANYRSQRNISQLNPWGFTDYLSDLFDAPEAVKAYLCKQYRLQDVPLGTQHTERNKEKAIKECQLRRFYTPGQCYNIRQSRYGNKNTSSTNTAVGEARLLNITVDLTAKREVEGQIQDLEQLIREERRRYGDLSSERKGCQARLNQLTEIKQGLLAQRDRRRLNMQQIDAKTKAIKRSETEAMDIKAEEEQCSKKIRSLNAKKIKLINEFKKLVADCVVKTKDKVRLSLQYSYAVQRKTKLENDIRDMSQKLIALESEFKNLQTLVREVKETAKRLMQVAREKTGSDEPSNTLKEAFKSYPNTIEEMDVMIHSERARAECYFETDQSVVEEYENRKEEIDKLSKEVETEAVRLDNHMQEIQAVRTEWLTALQKLIDEINANFSKFFSAMGCAGEVDLHKGENEDDYDKYGIRIRVKFRKTEALRELTSHYQSGGERSVSTILYLMALQELNRCPFRVVDEINQGMDPSNERRVFDLVVKTACKENTSQYFLITPKLLPNLSYGPKMKIMCIFNGHWMLPHPKWVMKGFLRRRKRIDAL